MGELLNEIVELVPPKNREELVEINHTPHEESDVYVYLDKQTGEVYVNAEHNLEKVESLGFPFWLRVLKRERVTDVTEHPYSYTPGRVAVEAAFFADLQAA